MTSFEPYLQIRRMIVKRDSRTVYDASFRPGLNIICGENSSGKSTLMDFLFYGLGGELADWRESALLCSEVVLEVTLNGHTAVLSREVSKESGRPMRIGTGTLAQLSSGEAEWGLYSYRRAQNKESFSQVIFRLLGMPEATGDANSNITMHQILRLLYADQLSPVDRIFRFERFDTELTRQTAGDLLCGGYDNLMYRRQLRQREANKELEAATAEYRNAIAIFSGQKHAINMDWLKAERGRISDEIAKTHAEASALEKKIFNAEVSDGLSIEAQNRAYAAVVEAQSELLDLQGERDSLKLEIADSAEFILALETKLDQLRDSAITAKSLKSISFIYCPSCFAPVEEASTDHACSLCKTPFDKERAQSRILAVINETGIQLKQSRSLQQFRNEQVMDLDAKVSRAKARWNAVSERYRLINRTPSTELRSRARELYSRAGYLERQLEDLSQKQIVLERIEALSKRRAMLTSEISDLSELIDAGERAQKEQLLKAYSLISKNAAKLLRQDLLRQDIFAKADRVDFNFGADRLAVNGESFFSASSMVYLRNSFFAGFLDASIQDPSFRHPRFLMLDTIEDKGIEPERSHHFQNLLAKMSDSNPVEHQLIYATSMISPQLAKSDYVVDRFYTHDSRTLALT
jgi:DNA repair exonuclease SbcCD ATPase subunit